MANKWETKEKQTKRLAIIISVILHLVIIVALSVSSGSNNSGEQSFLESIFGGGEDQADQTADLEQT